MPIRNSKGTALLEFALILPILLVFALAIIDFGLLIQARLIVTNVSREGGDIASRPLGIPTPQSDLITMLQTSATPLDLKGAGKICITNIVAGTSEASPSPTISTSNPQFCEGNLAVSSGITAQATNLGLTPAMYDHLVFNTASNTAADIQGVTVVEVFYQYSPVTPLPAFIPGILNNGAGILIGSRAVFCTAISPVGG
ncbi:MAG: pilus assembly protein [Syntrophobacteraceae bacterium]|nr:pilus assembly protein [Syntrophobacteraceae bacterium]